MSPRRVVILFIAALLVVVAAVWISSQRHLERSATTGQPLLPELKKTLDQVTEVRLAKANGNHTTLKKNGAEWIVYERNFVADTEKVRKLLLDLASLQVVEEKTSNPESYGAINVEDVPPANPNAAPPPKANEDFTASQSATRIDLVTPQKTWSVLSGKSGGYKNGYARVVGVKQSFLVSPRIEADVEPQRWLEHTIVDIPQARIQSVAVKPAKGPAYTVSREKKEQENFTVSNIPPKRKLSSESSGNSLASGLEGLSLDDVQKKPEAAPSLPPNTTVELSQATYLTFDGVTVEVNGRKEGAPGLKKDDPKVEKYYITLTASSNQKATQPEAEKIAARTAGNQFEISSYKYESIFKPLEELLEALPEKKDKSYKSKDKPK